MQNYLNYLQLLVLQFHRDIHPQNPKINDKSGWLYNWQLPSYVTGPRTDLPVPALSLRLIAFLNFDHHVPFSPDSGTHGSLSSESGEPTYIPASTYQLPAFAIVGCGKPKPPQHNLVTAPEDFWLMRRTSDTHLVFDFVECARSHNQSPQHTALVSHDHASAPNMQRRSAHVPTSSACNRYVLLSSPHIHLHHHSSTVDVDNDHHHRQHQQRPPQPPLIRHQP